MAQRRFIQVFNRYLNPGGEERSVARIARHLEAAGNEVTRFWRASSEWEGAAAPWKLRQAWLMWENRQVLDELRQAHLQTRPDAWILHNVVPVVSLGVYRLARELDVPIIQWLHNYRPLSPSGTLSCGQGYLDPADRWIPLKESLAGSWRGPMLTSWLALGYRRMARRGDWSAVKAWIAVSEEMRRTFVRGGFSDVYSLHHSWDLEDQSADTGDDGYFLYLGRAVETKGIGFLIDLWKDPALADTRLIVCGDGPDRAALQGRSPANVTWAGHVEGRQKRDLIARARAVLVPSLWPEPLPLVAYEAYQEGKPILASATGGIRELVFPETTGSLLAPGDRGQWLEAILHCHHNPALAAQQGGNGRRWLEENVSPARWNEKFEAIFAQAILNPSPKVPEA